MIIILYIFYTMGIKQIDTSSTWRKNGGTKIKNIKENIKEIGFFFTIIVLLIYISLTPNRDVEDKKEIQRIQRLKDSLEMEYYKKQLGTYPYNHSEIKDTSKTSF